MSIDSMLKTIKYNSTLLFDKGRSIGYSVGESDGYERGKTEIYEPAKREGYDLGLAQGYNDGYSIGFNDGKNSAGNPLEYARFLSSMFENTEFPEGYELTLNVPLAKGINNVMYGAKGIKKFVLKGNTVNNTVNFNGAFRQSSLETIDLSEFTAMPTTVNMMCYYSQNLVEILGEIDFSECTNTTNAFSNCSNLVTFTPKSNSIKLSTSLSACSKLSNASIQAIFDGLATVETAQTLTLPSSLKILQSQVDSANTKGWTVAGGTVVSEEEYNG